MSRNTNSQSTQRHGDAKPAFADASNGSRCLVGSIVARNNGADLPAPSVADGFSAMVSVRDDVLSIDDRHLYWRQLSIDTRPDFIFSVSPAMLAASTRD